MTDIFKNQKDKINQHQWKLAYNLGTHKANLLNEQSEPMDLNTLVYCLEALKNEAYDLTEKKYASQPITPLDELSKRRQGVVEYKLISDTTMASRSILEAYGDEHGTFAIDQFEVYENRRIVDGSSPIYLNYTEAKELMSTLQKFISRSKHLYDD